MDSYRFLSLDTVGALVVLTIAILVTAVPVDPAQAGRDPRLMDALSLMRSAMFRFEHDHASEMAVLGDSSAELSSRLTGYTRFDGSSVQREEGRNARDLSPYLPAIPENPLNRLATIRVQPDEVSVPITNGSAGWVYVPATGKIYPDLPGRDGEGTPYSRY